MEESNEVIVDSTETNEGGEGNDTSDTVSLTKSEYEKMNQTLGSLKRELKDLKKPKDTQIETPKTNQSDNTLLEKAFLRSAQISNPDEVELALSTAKKWGVSVDALVDDPDFQVKLEKLRTQKSNEIATSNIRGATGKSEAKNTPEYWVAKGTPPSPTDVPDRKTRAKIARAFLSNSKVGKTFYND